MITVFLLISFSCFLTLCSGILLNNFIKIEKELELYEYGFLGISFLIFLSLLIHFFFPLSENINFLTHLSIILITTILNKKIIINFLKQNYILILFCLIFTTSITIYNKTHEDYGFYHLPYIINIISEKIIFGLANIQPQYAWNSTWLNFSAFFYYPFFQTKSLVLNNSILYFFILFFFIKNILNIKKFINFNNFFVICFSYYFILKFNRLSAFGFDVAANFFTILCLIYFFYFLSNYQKKNIYFIFIFAILAFSIKISSFITIIICLLSCIILIKKEKKIRLNINVFLYFFLISFLWCTQQVIYSGCLFPFFKISCIETLSWYTPNITEATKNLTGAFNKSYSSYTGSMSKEEYLKNFNWVSTWFNRNLIEFTEHLSSVLIPSLILILLNLKQNFFKFKFKGLNNNHLKFLTLFTFIGLIIWFTKSPVIRFGTNYIYGLCFIAIYFFINVVLKDYKSISKKSIIYVFIICLTFAFLKNLKKINRNYNDLSYWPIFYNVKYEHKVTDNFKIYYPVSDSNFHQLKYCWDIPFLCHTNKGEKIKLLNKKNYIFVISKENEKN